MNKIEIGEKRNFNHYKGDYVLKEILEMPDVKMNWTWKTGLCPHCKKQIDRTVRHTFSYIEILIKENANENKLNIDDILIIGNTLDNRTMALSLDKYEEIFQKSKNYLHLVSLVKSKELKGNNIE